jgi:hypothetical protein
MERVMSQFPGNGFCVVDSIREVVESFHDALHPYAELDGMLYRVYPRGSVFVGEHLSQ